MEDKECTCILFVLFFDSDTSPPWIFRCEIGENRNTSLSLGTKKCWLYVGERGHEDIYPLSHGPRHFTIEERGHKDITHQHYIGQFCCSMYRTYNYDIIDFSASNSFGFWRCQENILSYEVNQILQRKERPSLLYKLLPSWAVRTLYTLPFKKVIPKFIQKLMQLRRGYVDIFTVYSPKSTKETARIFYKGHFCG